MGWVSALAVLALSGSVTSSPVPPPKPQAEAAAELAAVPVPLPRPSLFPAPTSSTPVVPPRRQSGPIVCRDPRLVGSQQVTFAAPGGCGIFEPVRLTHVAGVKLSSAAVLSCPTALALANWVSGVAQPAARDVLSARITRLWIMGSYACRSRNSQPGARLSEHAFGRAVDIGGMTLSTGQRVIVRKDWGQGAHGRFLRRIRHRACGAFKTVLGPGSDRFHHDHFHFDTAPRQRTYCR